MTEIIFRHKNTPNHRPSSATIQLEGASEIEPHKECADVIGALAGTDTVAIDFPNEKAAMESILKRLNIPFQKNSDILSIRISPTNDQHSLRSLLRECGYTSQQLAIGSTQQIDRYLSNVNRIVDFEALAADLTCIVQVECYKDFMTISSHLSSTELLQRLKKLPYKVVI